MILMSFVRTGHDLWSSLFPTDFRSILDFADLKATDMVPLFLPALAFNVLADRGDTRLLGLQPPSAERLEAAHPRCSLCCLRSLAYRSREHSSFELPWTALADRPELLCGQFPT